MITFPDLNVAFGAYAIGSCGTCWTQEPDLTGSVFLPNLRGNDFNVSCGSYYYPERINTNAGANLVGYVTTYPHDYLTHRGGVPTAEDAQGVIDAGLVNQWTVCPCAACQSGGGGTMETETSGIDRLYAYFHCLGPANVLGELDPEQTPPINLWYYEKTYQSVSFEGWNRISGVEQYFERWEWIVPPAHVDRPLLGILPLAMIGGLVALSVLGSVDNNVSTQLAARTRRLRR